jgi:hypothetical protein
MLNLAQQYNKSIVEEATLTPEQLKIRHVGKQDPKRHLNDAVEKAMGQQVVQSLGMGVLSEVSGTWQGYITRSSGARLTPPFCADKSFERGRTHHTDQSRFQADIDDVAL